VWYLVAFEVETPAGRLRMKRRQFLTLLMGVTTWSRSVYGQRGGTRKAGVLLSGVENDPDSKMRIAAFRDQLAKFGWRDGQNIHVEYRWAAGKGELIEQYAAELVTLAPDVILANSTTVVEAFKRINTSIPVVFALAIDPVGMGHVNSLSHPGGNFTGFTFIDPELIGKWTDLLKDLRPSVTRAALLFNPATSPFYFNFVREVEAARQPGEIELVVMSAATPAEMQNAIGSLAQKPGSSLLIGPDPFNLVHIGEIAQAAARNLLPAVSVYRPFAVEGGLMAYGPDTADIFRRSAGYVDRVLRGANPAELPVQQPDKFEFTINLKAAKTLGLTVPPTLLAAADEVIE
jgi:putative ABC transport system substrate-binding protein